MHVRGGHLPLQASGRSPKGMAEGKRWSWSALEMLQIQLADSACQAPGNLAAVMAYTPVWHRWNLARTDGEDRLRASELGCSCLVRCVPQSQRASTLLACAICNGLTAAPSCRNACLPRRACAQCARHRLHRSTTRVHSGRQAIDGRHGH